MIKAAGATVLLACTACAAPSAPHGIAPAATLMLELSFPEGPYSHRQPRRPALSLLVAEGEETSDAGTAAIMLTGTEPGHHLSEVRWQRRAETLEIGSARVSIPPGSLAWDHLELRLRDDDGDGLLDVGRGEAEASWEAMVGDVMDFAELSIRAEWAADEATLSAELRALDPLAQGVLAPFDPLEVALSKPFRWAGESQAGRPLVNGERWPVAPDATVIVAGAASRLLVRPPEGWTPGAEVGFDLASTAGASGEVIEPAEPLPVSLDPGPLTRNPGFERGFEGWDTRGKVRVAAEFQGISPADGTSQAVVLSGGRLAGYFDVPADAQTLELTVAVLSEIGEFDAGRSAYLELVARGEAHKIVDASGLTGGGPCSACEGFGSRIPPARVQASLAAFRGQRVWLVARARASGYLGMNQYALLLDDIRVR